MLDIDNGDTTVTDHVFIPYCTRTVACLHSRTGSYFQLPPSASALLKELKKIDDKALLVEVGTVAWSCDSSGGHVTDVAVM